MRICYVAEAPFIHTHRWANYFAARGHDVHVVSLRYDEIAGAEVHELKTRIPCGKLEYLLVITKARNLIRKINPDILHAHYATSYGLIAACSGFHPLFLTCHGDDVLISPRQSYILKNIVRYVLSEADVITSVAKHMTEELIKLGVEERKISTFQYGVDTGKFRRRYEIDSYTNVPMILSTRQLKPIYNIEIVLRSAPLLLKKIPSARFVIVGDGPEEEKLKRISDSLGIRNNVEFVGKVSPEEIIKYLNSATVFVSTSLSDGTSISLLEAMACEVFPVVTDIQANREWIKDGQNGFLVPTDSPVVLAQKIIQAINDTSLREKAGRHNADLVKEKADFQKNMSMMEEIYFSYPTSKIV